MHAACRYERSTLFAANRILIAACCSSRWHTPALLGLAYRSLGMLDVGYRDADEHGGVVCTSPGRYHS